MIYLLTLLVELKNLDWNIELGKELMDHFHKKILINDVFGFAEHQKNTRRVRYKLTSKKNSDSVV